MARVARVGARATTSRDCAEVLGSHRFDEGQSFSRRVTIATQQSGMRRRRQQGQAFGGKPWARVSWMSLGEALTLGGNALCHVLAAANFV